MVSLAKPSSRFLSSTRPNLAFSVRMADAGISIFSQLIESRQSEGPRMISLLWQTVLVKAAASMEFLMFVRLRPQEAGRWSLKPASISIASSSQVHHPSAFQCVSYRKVDVRISRTASVADEKDGAAGQIKASLLETLLQARCLQHRIRMTRNGS